MGSDWKDRMTPFDMELLKMVESLMGKPCEPQRWRNGYSFRVDYEGKEVDWVAAVMAAVEGRTGARFAGFKDCPEQGFFTAKVRFAEKEVFQYGDERDKEKEDVTAGDVYCRVVGEIRAVCVKRTNLSQLQKFVGGGEMRIPRCPGCPATFHFLNGSVFLDVEEGDYLCRGKNGFYRMSRRDFEDNYEPK